MIWFLVAAVGLWWLGRQMGTPRKSRWIMIGVVYVAILVLLTALPIGNPLQQFLGGSFGEWLILGVLVVVVAAYSLGLSKLKARAQKPVQSATPGKLAGTELERYARHIMLREIGGPGQKRLKSAKVLVVGAGGLGSPALMYLGAAGVGTIGVIDDDDVENTNLQRQIIHTDDRIGMPKVFSAQAGMTALNPFTFIRPYNRRLTNEIGAELVAEYDLVLDGTDNFETRYLVNEVCVAAGKPLISAALTQWEGQISIFDPARGAPCYACVFPEAPAAGLAPSCAEAGVAGPLPGVVGSMMAVEAVKEITQAGETLRGRLMIYDALYAESRVIRVERRPDCACCGNGRE